MKELISDGFHQTLFEQDMKLILELNWHRRHLDLVYIVYSYYFEELEHPIFLE